MKDEVSFRAGALWDHVRVYHLCRLWVAGCYWTEIGREIGITANKAIFMAYKLGLPRRPTFGKVLDGEGFRPLATPEEFDRWWTGFGSPDTPDWVFRVKRIIEQHRRRRARWNAGSRR